MFTLLRTHGSFEESICKFYASEVLLLLNFLHTKHIIYRDLKPENILIGEDGHIKIVDFGIAKELLDEKALSFCGTSEYMAPEIILGDLYDFSVDFWSFGILMYCLSTNQRPYYDISTSEIPLIISSGIGPKFEDNEKYPSNTEQENQNDFLSHSQI